MECKHLFLSTRRERAGEHDGAPGFHLCHRRRRLVEVALGLEAWLKRFELQRQRGWWRPHHHVAIEGCRRTQRRCWWCCIARAQHKGTCNEL